MIDWLDHIHAPGWIFAAALGVVILAGVFRTIRKTRPMIHKAGQFFDDWGGEPSRPGVPERPGVMARLAKVEHELLPNSGHSLRDQTDRLEAAQIVMAEHMNTIGARLGVTPMTLPAAPQPNTPPPTP